MLPYSKNAAKFVRAFQSAVVEETAVREFKALLCKGMID